MKKLFYFAVIGLSLFFFECSVRDTNSAMQNIVELTHTYSREAIAQKMRSVEYIILRSSSKQYDGYALKIKTCQFCDDGFNVFIKVNHSILEKYKTMHDSMLFNQSDGIFYKILDTEFCEKTVFHSLKQEKTLFEKKYGCTALEIISLIMFCYQYHIIEMVFQEDGIISIKTPNYFLYNSNKCELSNSSRLEGDWYYEKY